MTGRPPERSDEPEAVDPVMLAVLSNKARRASPLSVEQERLIDEWVAGRLGPDEAARAEALTRDNSTAAERVLERRLLEASARDAAVPEALSTKVLAAMTPAPAASPAWPARRSWWQGLRVGWTGALGLAAMAVILVIALVPLLQRAFEGGDLQVAMATIGDRNALFEPSDVRLRGPGPPPPPADLRFRDVEIPTAVLRELLKAAGGTPGPDTARAVLTYLPAAAAGPPAPHVVVDAALRQRIDGATSERLPVRIYDLADPRAADIRKLLGPAGEGRAWLLTLKP
jgi:hypothetical protein